MRSWLFCSFFKKGLPEKEVKVKYLVYLMEKASRATDESKGIEKLNWVVDYKDFSQLAGIVLTKVSKEILDVLQDHYPGFIFKLFPGSSLITSP